MVAASWSGEAQVVPYGVPAASAPARDVVPSALESARTETIVRLSMATSVNYERPPGSLARKHGAGPRRSQRARRPSGGLLQRDYSPPGRRLTLAWVRLFLSESRRSTLPRVGRVLRLVRGTTSARSTRSLTFSRASSRLAL